MRRESEILGYLRIHGHITDIGQIAPAQRRQLARLVASGAVTKSQSLAFPIPKWRYTLNRPDLSA